MGQIPRLDIKDRAHKAINLKQFEEVNQVWKDLTEDRWKRKYYNRTMPNLPKQDNKKTYVGGGGDNRNRIRYPSLKRSKTTWRRFYALFPNAERRREV